MGLVTLPFPPYSSPMVDQNGVMTSVWSMWFQQMYARIGATSAVANVNPSQSAASAPLTSLPVGNINTTIYTSPSGQSTIIGSFTAVNNDSVSHSLSVYIVPVGSQPTASTLVVGNFVVTPGTTALLSALQNSVIGSGGFVVCVASVPSAIIVSMSGRVVS